mmetsp:Transcript_8522/g.21011  ORF Transcript_8522/g.21011 Transcript_8522/m.21011 type:complete len:165 (-) Transcript_8522:78-572(-)
MSHVLSTPHEFSLQTRSKPGGILVAAVHSKSVLTLSTPDPLTRIVAGLAAVENAAAVVVDIVFGVRNAFNNRVIETRSLGETFIAGRTGRSCRSGAHTACWSSNILCNIASTPYRTCSLRSNLFLTRIVLHAFCNPSLKDSTEVLYFVVLSLNQLHHHGRVTSW